MPSDAYDRERSDLPMPPPGGEPILPEHDVDLPHPSFHGEGIAEEIEPPPEYLQYAPPADAIDEQPIPQLPANATPEEKDAYWFKYIYRGDQMPQLTLRAVVMGGILGMFMAISNLYTTLQLGFYFGVAITASVLSYVIWNGMRLASGNRLRPMTILENNCMQSTATAAGSSTGNTVGVAFGALLLMTGVHTSAWYLVPFVFLTAALGVFVAVPVKRQMINVEQLPFPSGIAAAETLRSLHSHGKEAMRKAISLICSLCVGAFVGFFKFNEGLISFIDRIYAATFHITDFMAFGGRFNPLARRSLGLDGLGFEPGTLMVAAGAFIGMRVALSMMAGSVLLYYVVMPLFVSHGQWLYIKGTAHAVASSDLVAGSMILPTKWALWGGASIMLFSSLASIGVQWRTMARAFNVFRRRTATPGGAPATDGSPSSAPAVLDHAAPRPTIADVEVPFSWVVIGVIPIGIGLIVVCHKAFNMSWWLGAIAVAMSFITSLVASRASGETDFTPTGAMGKITQLLYAVLAQGNRVVNLMSAGVTSAAAAAGADLLGDLKSGYLLGAHPRKQFIAQFCGIFFGVAVIVPAWYLMVPDKAALETFKLPSTLMWKAVADTLTLGLHTILVSARFAIVIGAILGIALPVLGAVFPRTAPYLPSAMGLGLSWVVPFQTSLSFLIGAGLVWIWTKGHKRSAETYIYPVASGLIAGESIALALLAMTATAVKLLHR